VIGPFPASSFDLVSLRSIAEIRLGKMLQTAPGTDGDVEWPYLRAGHLSGLPGELPTMWASPRDCSNYSVETGDVLVAEGGDVGRAEFVPDYASGAIIQNSLHRLRPRGERDRRYLRYVLEAVYHGDWLEVLCNRSTFGHLTVEKLGSLRVPDPDPGQQRAIADYLDAETARIDGLIAKKRQLTYLIEERRETAFDKALSHFGVELPVDLDPEAMRSLSRPEVWRVAKLSSALRQLTNGYVGPTRDILVDEGIRYIQGLHIKKGTIGFERRPFFVTESWHRARPRTSLRPGDVVIVQTGDIGQCAVIPEDFGEANCHALLIARANSNVTSGEYLASYLQSSFGRHSLLRLATGALHPHLEFGIRDAALLLPPLAEQSEIVGAVRHEQARLDVTRETIGRQISLLAEHRQALITAAVTGDYIMSGAA
jgi:type I restriction enzyme, S subunit